MNASNKVQSVNTIHSVDVNDNILMNKVVNNKPSINTTPSNTRKRTASMGPTVSNSRIRIDYDGYKYPSKPNTVPIRSQNVVNNNIVLENKFANLAQFPVEREIPHVPHKIQTLMVKNNYSYETIHEKLSDENGNINASLANEYSVPAKVRCHPNNF
ncbi:hypothetical protein AVEN_192798-1 [Araneus ventricosus]|uniref:Uncharacterized protein n=1 Tax=Araneus ventricosus TaxID=182803 RepID=A0A4Y2TPN7_ARAVE|nr:hypothetical protein AVEN_192798-1 [Araneus ventricosus]